MADFINFEALRETALNNNVDVTQVRNALKTFLQDQFPSLIVDVGPGADTILGPTSTILATANKLIEIERQKINIESALQDGADPFLFEEELNNRGIELNRATTAKGTARIVIPLDTSFSTVTLNNNVRLTTFGGLSYRPITRYVFSVTEQPGATTLTLSSAGYIADFEIESTGTGEQFNIPVGSMLVPDVNVLNGTNFYTVSDITGGTSSDTAEDVLTRLSSASTDFNLFTEAGIKNIVASIANDSEVFVVGSGAEGMTRGMSPLGTYAPGRVDARIKHRQALSSTVVRVEATLVQDDSGVGVWQFTSNTGEPYAPVFVHRVWKDNLLPAPGAEYNITERSLAINNSSDLLDKADIKGAQQAAFTTAGLVTCKFRDTDTPLGGLTVGTSKKFYSAIIRYHHQINEIQNYMYDFLTTSGDCVARGVTPVRVLVNAVINDNSTSSITPEEIKSLISQTINKSPISTTLSSGIVFAAQLPQGMTLATVDLTGFIHKQDGTIQTLSTAQILDTGIDPENGLAEGTVGFFCDPDDVSLTIN